MSGRSYRAVVEQVHRLFRAGSAVGLSEWQLLDRYTTGHDEAAFEALVARHGPMVLNVCRRMLDDPHAVEDAFQATFLILVRKARSLSERDAIGHWLYGVACRVALRARSDAARRSAKETQLDKLEIAGLDSNPASGELAAILDEELRRLPDKYRAPIVLCYLEGQTHEEAAAQLQWPLGTVKGRLSRARNLLRDRLSRRGVPASVAVVVVALSHNARAAVPAALLSATLQTASRFLARGALTSAVSASIVRLMEGGLSTMFLSKLPVAATLLGTCGLLTLGAWTLARPPKPTTAPPNGTINASANRSQRQENAQRDGAASTNGTIRPQDLDTMLGKPLPLKLKGARLENLFKAIKERSANAYGNTGTPIYVDPEGLQEAGATLESATNFDAENVPLSAALDSALRPLKLGASARDGLVLITSRSELALIEIQRLNEQYRQNNRGTHDTPGGESNSSTADQAAGGAVSGLSPADHLELEGETSTTYDPLHDRRARPDLEAKTKAILQALDRPVAMSFANETPLQDVLKYVESVLADATSAPRVPVYVDPAALQDAGKTMASPVTIDLEGAPLRQSLTLVLDQLGLTYFVKDGILRITSVKARNTLPTPLQIMTEKAKRGELGAAAMQELIEVLKLREQVERYEEPSPPTRGRAAGGISTSAADTSGGLERSQAVEAALDQPITALRVQEKPFGEALEAIRKATVGTHFPSGIPIHVNPRAWNQTSEKPKVTIDLQGVRLRTALRLVADQVGLAYTIDDGLIIIDTPETFSRNAERRRTSP